MAIPPNWTEDFVQQLSYCLFPAEVPAPLGCHYHFEMGCWEIAIFPSMRKNARGDYYLEEYRPSPFTFDIQQMLPLFEDIQHLDWVAIPTSLENEVGPHLLIEGVVDGHCVLVRICSEVPLRFQQEPGLMLQEKEQLR